MNRKCFILLFLFSLFVLACNTASDEILKPDGQVSTEEAIEIPKQYEDFVENLSSHLSEKLLNIEAPPAHDLQAEVQLKSAKSLRFPSLVEALYQDFRPVFLLADGSFSQHGKALLDALKSVDEHALSNDFWDVNELENSQKELTQLLAELEIVPGIWLNEAEKFYLANLLVKEEFLPNPENEKKLLERLVQSTENSPIPRIAAAYELWKETSSAKTTVLRTVEFSMADAYLFYAKTLKYGNLDKFSAEEWEKFTTESNRNDIHPKHFDTIIAERLSVDFEEFRKLGDGEVQLKISKLAPQHEQYGKLQKLRERYRGMVLSGDWEEIQGEAMNRNGRAPKVVLLKERLQKEGYFNGQIDDLFDEELFQAVKDYQETHQLEVTGLPHDVFWRSVNIKAADRLAEIEANIRRWFHSMYEERQRYIYVNIPSFTAEIWDAGKKLASHKIVAGSSTRFCNTRTMRWDRMNSTPLLHARLTYLVYNPYWNVPPRIEVDEYQKKLAADPKWLEKSDFEYFNPRGGGRVLRQKPGPQNALGRVKLIFPNKHNVYFHDTPKQAMFSYPVRAFSHGCLRVEDAMDFAKTVLTLDEQYDPKRIERFFVERGEHPVDLKTPIDVFIDYHTVTVDDQERGHFLADVYRFVRDEVNPPRLADLTCDPTRDKISEFRASPVDDVGP